MASLAEEHFNAIMAGKPTPAKFLKEFGGSTPPIYEDDWRGFKAIPDADDKGKKLSPKSMDDTIKRYWSKSLSAFGNAGGGVLVWGIDARFDPESRVDAVSELKPISDTDQHKSRILQLLPFATDPPLTGVRIEEIPESHASKSGFVVCLIPESNDKPLRAEHLEGKPYYLRCGGASLVIGRSTLRSLFFPQSRSRLVMYRVFDGATNFQFGVRNEGPATARNVLFRFAASKPRLFESLLCRDEQGAMAPLRGYDMRAHLSSIRPYENYPVMSGTFNVERLQENPSVSFTIYADDQMPLQFNCELSRELVKNPPFVTTDLISVPFNG